MRVAHIDSLPSPSRSLNTNGFFFIWGLSFDSRTFDSPFTTLSGRACTEASTAWCFNQHAGGVFKAALRFHHQVPISRPQSSTCLNENCSRRRGFLLLLRFGWWNTVISWSTSVLWGLAVSVEAMGVLLRSPSAPHRFTHVPYLLPYSATWKSMNPWLFVFQWQHQAKSQGVIHLF